MEDTSTTAGEPVNKLSLQAAPAQYVSTDSVETGDIVALMWTWGVAQVHGGGYSERRIVTVDGIPITTDHVDVIRAKDVGALIAKAIGAPRHILGPRDPSAYLSSREG